MLHKFVTIIPFLGFEETVLKELVALREDVSVICQKVKIASIGNQGADSDVITIHSIPVPADTCDEYHKLNEYLASEESKAQFVSSK